MKIKAFEFSLVKRGGDLSPKEIEERIQAEVNVIEAKEGVVKSVSHTIETTPKKLIPGARYDHHNTKDSKMSVLIAYEPKE